MKRLILITLLLFSGFSHATNRILAWEGEPLKVTLPVGKEVILALGGDVRVGVPSSFYRHASLDSLKGKIFITASQPFESQRIQIERLRDGERILLDVRAQQEANTPSRIDIVMPDEQQRQKEARQDKDALGKYMNQLQMPVPALLVRFAQQSLYSPAHAIEPLPGIARSAMHLDKDIAAQAFPLWSVNAQPLAAWKLKGYTVTAIKLTHKNNEVLNLDPRQVSAGAYGVSFAYPDLGPAATDSAINTAFIVTPGPLYQYLPPATRESSHDQ